MAYDDEDEAEKARRARAAAAAGGVRSSDPETSFEPAEDEDKMAKLDRNARAAFEHADSYTDGCMTACDVAFFHGVNTARDHYSSSVSRLNDAGVLIYVKKRLGLNSVGNMAMQQAYRLWRPGDPEVTDPKWPIPPSKKTPLDRVLKAFRGLTLEEQLEFARRCGQVSADVVYILYKLTLASERAVLKDWICNDDEDVD
jgi:hypothetical protein